ncbi:alginate export family protein, partial [Burkholderia pseudomallei]|nr:alginate export family protein [Burkholderia pseudomallei]
MTRTAARLRASLVALLPLWPMAAAAQATDAPIVPDDLPTQRPAIMTNRWQERWYALANPALRTEPLDSLKYIPLSATDPYSYVSLGAVLRERFESSDAGNFGVGKTAGDSYL